MRPYCAAILLAIGAVSSASASGVVTDLGKPTNNLPRPPASMLDGFARKGPVLTQARKPEVLFIGTQVFGYGGVSAVERWALVKALDQFGRFTGAKATTTQNCVFITGHARQCYPSDKYSGYATFDLDHARYTSRYLALVHKDLVDGALHVHTDFSPVESSLIQRYIRRYVISTSSQWADFAWQVSIMPPENHGLPLVSIGGYLRVDSGVAITGDLTPAASTMPLSFSAVQASLRRGKAAGGAPYSLVPDVNAEVNVLTALVCRADRDQPRAVCARAPVRAVLKHLK
jgi:hypothetical protein